MKKGWRVKALGELCRIELGSTPARGHAAFWDEKKQTKNIWLSIADLPQTLHAVANDSKEYVSDTAVKNMRKVPAGTLLVSFKLTLGRLAYAGIEICTNEAIASLLDLNTKEISKEYLYWALTAFDWNKAAEGDEKIKGKTLNKAKLKLLPIPLPPLDEQRKIVAILDEAFEGIDRARANVEANLKSAIALFEASLGAYFSLETTTQHHWNMNALRNVSDITYGYTTKATDKPTGPKLLRITDIQNKSVNWGTVPFCSEPPEDYERYRIKSGDIVFARTGATTGKSYLMVDDTDAIAASYLIRLRPTSTEIRPDFLAYYFQSDIYWNAINSGITGSAQGGFNASKLGAISIPIPSISHQEEIVEKLKNLEARTTSLSFIFQAKLNYLSDLRQSLLQKAFAGELT